MSPAALCVCRFPGIGAVRIHLSSPENRRSSAFREKPVGTFLGGKCSPDSDIILVAAVLIRIAGVYSSIHPGCDLFVCSQISGCRIGASSDCGAEPIHPKDNSL